MGTLSDIAAKFKSTLGKISTEAGQIKGAMTDVANKYGQDQGFVGNLGSVVNKGLVGALDIAGGATDFVKSQAQQIADYTPAAYELITTGKAPAGFNPDKQNYYQGGEQIQRGATALSDTISAKPIANLISEISGPGVISDTAKGAGFILDPYQNIIGNAGSSIEKASKGDKVGAGIALGTSVLSALPFSRLGTIVGGSIGGSIMGATGANKYLEDTTKQFSEKRTTDLQKEGYSPEEAMARANNEAGGVSLAIMALSQIFGGLKVGGKGTVASTLKKPVNQVTLGDVVKHNLKYGGTSASIQSMEGDVLKYIAGIDSDPDAKKYAGVIAGNFLSGVTPGSFGGAKGKPMSKKGSLSQIAEENAAQTKMDVTPKVEADINTPRPVGEKGPLQTAMDNIAQYEDYVANIKSTGKMPTGKKATKKDYDFMNAEYKRLTDIKNNVGKTPDTELVDLGGGKGTLVKEKVLALPEPKEAPIAREQVKRDAYLSDLESKRSEASSQGELDRLSKEFDDYNSKIETESNVGQAGRDRDTYLADLEQQRVDYANQQELDTANQRLAGEFDQYRGDQINSQLESDAIMNNPKVTPLSKFTETNPTVEQATVAELARKAMNEGRSPNTIFEQSNLTPEQKKLIIEEYQADVTYNQTNPKTLSDIAKEQKSNGDAADIEPPGGNAPGAGKLYEVANQNVIQNPTIEMKQSGGEKARGWLNSNINFQGFLNNLAIKGPDGKAISADSYMEQSRGVANNVARAIVAPLEDIILSITKNTKGGIPKVQLNAEDLIGGVTHEGIPITKENYKKVYDTYANIDGQQIGQKHTILEDNPRIQMQKKSFIYDVLKEDPKKLSKYFTPEEITAFQKIDDLETQTYSKYAQDLVDAGYLKDIEVANEYVRYVMGRKNYERAIKDMGIKDEGFIVPLKGGGVKKFDNVEDLLKYYRYQDKVVKNGGASEIRPDEGGLASILKSKAGNQFDVYRTHGAVNRLMSYGDSIGNLYGDQFKSNLFDQLAESTDPGVQAYMNNLLTSKNHQNIIQEAYGIKEAPGVQEKLSRLGTIAAIAGNAKSFTAALVSSPIKAVSVVASNLYKNTEKLNSIAAGINGSIFKSKEVKNVLSAEGFTTGYELMEGGSAGFIKNAADKTRIGKYIPSMDTVMSVSSGTPAENLGKSVIAMNGMHKILTQNGYNPGTTPESIVRAWQTFKKEKPSEYLGAHESILKDTRFIADVSDSARLQVGWGRKLLAPIKTYALQQTKTAFDDIVDSVAGLTGSKKGYENITEGATKRTIARIMTVALGYLGAQAIVDKADQELEDYLEGKVNAEFGYDPISLGKSALGINAIAAIPINMLSDITQTAMDALKGRTDLASRTALKGLNQNLAVARSLDNISRETTGKSFSEWISGYDPANITERGISKGNEYSDDIAMKIFRAAGFNENYWEEQFARENLDEIIPSEWKPQKLRGMQFNTPTVTDMMKVVPIAGSFVQPVMDIQGNMESFLQRSQGLDAMTTAKQIDGSKDIDEALAKTDLSIVDRNAIKTKLEEQMNGYMSDNTNIKLSLKKEFLDFTNRGTQMDLNRLKEVNPVIYNDLVSIVSQAQTSDNPSNTIHNWKQTTPQEQAMIAQYNKTIPLETSLSNEVGKRVANALGVINSAISYNEIGKPEFTADGRAKLDEALGKVNKMAEFFVRMKDDMATHENGVALHSTNIKNSLSTIQDLQLGGSLPLNFLDGFPFLRTLVKNGIQLKGEELTQPTQGTPTDQPASKTIVPAQGSLSAIASSGYGAKAPKWKNIEYKEKKIEPLIKSSKTMSLSELAKSQSSKSPMKSGQRTK